MSKKEIFKKWNSNQLTTLNRTLQLSRAQLNKSNKEFNSHLKQYFDSNIEFFVEQLPEIAAERQKVVSEINNRINKLENVIQQGGYSYVYDTTAIDKIMEDYSLIYKNIETDLEKFFKENNIEF